MMDRCREEDSNEDGERMDGGREKSQGGETVRERGREGERGRGRVRGEGTRELVEWRDDVEIDERKIFLRVRRRTRKWFSAVQEYLWRYTTLDYGSWW